MLELLLNTKGIKSAIDGMKCDVKYNIEKNSIYSLTFKVYTTETGYRNIFPKLTNVKLYDTTDPEVIVFEGLLSSKKDRMESNGTTYAECKAYHIIDNLHSTSVVGFRMWSGNYSSQYGLFATYAIDKLIAYHNNSTSDDQKIGLKWDNRLSTFDGTSVDYISAGTVFEAVLANINRNDWDFKPVYENAQWKIAISSDFGSISNQHVIVGVNMRDVSRAVDAKDLVTRIIPVGSEGYIPMARLNPSMDELALVQGIGDQAWVKTGALNLYGYSKSDPPYRDVAHPEQIYIANPTLESKYPPIERVVEYSDISCEIADDYLGDDGSVYNDAQRDLYERCKQDVVALTDMVEEYETTAFDLSKMGYDADKFELYDICHIVNNELEINTWMQIVAIEINYSNPAETKLTFGKIGRSLAKQIARGGKTTAQKIADNSHRTNETLNKRTDGLNFRHLSSTEYESITNKNDNTLYTVDDAGETTASLYIGDKQISGGGSGTTVENAAVLLGSEFHDYLINETLMLSIQPPTAIYYGANMDDPDDHARSFVVVQGHYCTRSWSGSRASMVVYDSQTGKFTIGGADGLFEAIIANRDKFGSIYGDDNGGGFFRFSGNSDTYPKIYRTAYYEFTSASMETKVVSGVNETATSYHANIYTPTYNTEARTGNWWEVGVKIVVSSKNIGSGAQKNPKSVDNTSKFYGSIVDMFMVPNITAYTNSLSENRPFGYVTVDGFYIFAQDENLEWGVDYWPGEGSSFWLNNVPLASRAEQYFLLGVSKKTEPQTT